MVLACRVVAEMLHPPTMMLFQTLSCSIALVVLFGYSLGYKTNACDNDGACKCFNEDEYVFTVNCSHQNLSEVPQNIPSNVSKLNLSYNYLKKMPEDVFNRTTYLKMLRLDNNHLEQIPRTLLLNVINLEYLDLTNNSLAKFGKQTFYTNHKVKTIFLSSNRLQEIPTGLFKNNPDLVRIYLSSNKLTEIAKGAFANNDKLKQLDISQNRLTKIADYVFSKNASITDLYLSYNNIEEVSSAMLMNMSKLINVHLCCNKLVSIQGDAFANNIFIKFLDLSNNAIKKFPEGIFKTLEKLTKLNLSNNAIKIFPDGIFKTLGKLTKLYLSNNKLEELSRGIFEYNSLLNVIHLSHNKLERLLGDQFANTTRLKSIKLQNNCLKVLPKGLFVRNQLLKTLNLANNYFTKLPIGLFERNQMLTSINLTNNYLEALPIGLFEKNPMLEKLYLSSNSLKHLSVRIFEGNPMFKTLFLSFNQLEKLPERLFVNNAYLTTIFLTNNGLKELPESTFNRNPILQDVILSHNHLNELSKGLFEQNRMLNRLSLDNNSLTDIEKDMFVHNTALKYLTFCKNKLKIIPEDIFRNNTLLDSVDFTENHIQRIPDKLLYSTSKLRILRVCSNNLKEIPANLFGSIEGLISLAVCKNSLTSIDKSAFNGSKSVQYLSLYGNNLTSLPKDLFSYVRLDEILYLSDNEITEIPKGLFCTTEICDHDLTWLLLHNNNLTYLARNCFKGLHKLLHIFLHGNKLQALGDDVFAGTTIQYIYMFSNNLTEVSNKSFDNGCLREVQLYKNNIRIITDNTFPARQSPTHLYIYCQDLLVIPVFNKNITASCVNSGLTPKITLTHGVASFLGKSLISDGFNCSYDKDSPECSPCPPGTYSDGVNACQPCQEGGFYQDDFGHLDCEFCPKGTFVNYTGGKSKENCELCPEGTDLDRQAGHRACFCKKNYARIHRFRGCALCLEEGLNCSQDFKSLQPGYYWNWTFPGANITEYSNFVLYLQNDSLHFNETNKQYRSRIPKVHVCPHRFSCENRDSYTATGIQGRCKNGYRGWLCSKCQSAFYSVMSTCLPCPNKIWIVLEVTAILCLGVGVYILILWQNKKHKKKANNERSIVDKISSQMKIVLGFYQVVGELFESFHDVTWAGPLKFAGEIISVLKVNILRVVIRPHCYSERLYINAKLQFIISLSFPIALTLVLVSLYHVWKLYLKFQKPGIINQRGENLQKAKEKLFTYAILLLFITYPPTCDVIFKLYPGACMTFYIYENDTSVKITRLRSDFDIDCETLNTYHTLAYVATVVYVVSFPCLLLLLLRKYCKKSTTKGIDDDNNDFETQSTRSESETSCLINEKREHAVVPVWVKFLCENYKTKFWYWEIIELVRKVIQTILVTLLGWEDVLTKLLTIGTSVLFLTFHARLSPMTSNFEQRLQMFSLAAIFVNVLIASVPIPQNYQSPISTMLIVMNMIIMLIIAGEVILYIINFIRGKFFHVPKKIKQSK